MDPQGNASSGFDLRTDENTKNIYDVMLGEAKIEEAVIRDVRPKLSIIPSDVNLAACEIQLSDKEGRNTILKEALNRIRENYEFIIIDCPPSLNILTLNAMCAGDTVLVPLQCEYYALEGLTQLLSTIRLVQKLFNPKLHIEGVLLTMFDIRVKLSLEVQQEVRKYFKERVYKVSIPRNVKLSEAPSHGKSIFQYDIKSSGSRAYVALAKEVIERNTPEVK